MKRVFILFSLISFVVIFSCKKEINKKIKTSVKQKNLKPDIDFNFPDTVYLNKSYNGVIKYKGRVLDTFNILPNSDLDKDGKARFVFYRLTKTKTKSISDELIFNNKEVDTLISKTNTEILIKNIKFTETGVNYIDGLLTDEVYIAIENEELRIITKEYRITKKVIVVDSTLVVNSNTKASLVGTI